MCKKILQDIDLETGVSVVMAKVDIVESPAVTLNYGVMGVPTVVFLRHGKPVHQVTFTRNIPKAKISKIMKEYLGV